MVSMIEKYLVICVALLVPALGCGNGGMVTPTNPVNESIAVTPTPTETSTPTPTATPTGTPTEVLQTPTPTPTPSPTPTPTLPPTPTATATVPPTPTLPPDQDGDGVPDGLDCAPDDPTISPDTPEVCDGIDRDCDGLVDEGFDVDGDGVKDCEDEETCDSQDNDGDDAIDEDTSDLDGDGICDERDADRDGDRVDNDDDPAPDDAAINSLPTGYFYSPGAAPLTLFAPTAAVASVYIDTGEGSFVELDGSPVTLSTEGLALVSIPLAGVVRVDATSPVLAFYGDGDGVSDGISAGMTATGQPSGDVVYFYGGRYGAVVGTLGSPGFVKVEANTGGAWGQASSVSLSEGGGHTFSLPTTGLYRVRAPNGEVAAYGYRLDSLWNGFTYLISPSGASGNNFSFIKASSAPSLNLALLSVDGASTVKLLRSGVPVDQASISASGGVARFPLQDNKIHTLSSTAPAIAWVEPLGGDSGSGEIMDLSLVPPIDPDSIAQSYLFRLPKGGVELPSVLPEVDIIAYDDETAIYPTVEEDAEMVPYPMFVLQRGKRYRFITNGEPGSLVNIESTRPVMVVLSNGDAQFQGSAYIGAQFRSEARFENETCDPEGLLDHCAVGYVCGDFNICVSED